MVGIKAQESFAAILRGGNLMKDLNFYFRQLTNILYSFDFENL